MSAHNDCSSAENALPHYGNTHNAVGCEALLGAIATAAANQEKNMRQCCVLDAGCGTGNYLSVVAPLVGHIVAIDSSNTMLECAANMYRNSYECHHAAYCGAMFSSELVDLNAAGWPEAYKKRQSDEQMDKDDDQEEEIDRWSSNRLPLQYDAIYCCQVLQQLYVVDDGQEDDTSGREKNKRFVGVELQHAITKSVAEKAPQFEPIVRTEALIGGVSKTYPLTVLYDVANYCAQGQPVASFIGSTTQPLTQEEREKILANGTFYSESPPNVYKPYKPVLPTDVATLQRVLCQRSQRCLLCWADTERDCDEICKMALPPLSFTIRLCFRALKDIVIKV